MERKRITCPETAKLEVIDFERTPFGIVLGGCSRFAPGCAIECAGECARRMDLRDRKHADDRSERVLLVYADAQRTLAIASAVAAALARDGLIVELADADTGAIPPPWDYEAVVIGSSLRFGRHARSIRRYIAMYRDALEVLPAFLFVVSRTGAANTARLRRDTGWSPVHVAGFVRRGWLALWFSDMRLTDERVDELALAIADEIPALERDATAAR